MEHTTPVACTGSSSMFLVELKAVSKVELARRMVADGLACNLNTQNNPPRSGVPNPENRDLRQLLWHRHRLVQMRTRILTDVRDCYSADATHFLDKVRPCD
jgi:hypothetical protein